MSRRGWRSKYDRLAGDSKDMAASELHSPCAGPIQFFWPYAHVDDIGPSTAAHGDQAERNWDDTIYNAKTPDAMGIATGHDDAIGLWVRQSCIGRKLVKITSRFCDSLSSPRVSRIYTVLGDHPQAPEGLAERRQATDHDGTDQLGSLM